MFISASFCCEEGESSKIDRKKNRTRQANEEKKTKLEVN